MTNEKYVIFRFSDRRRGFIPFEEKTSYFETYDVLKRGAFFFPLHLKMMAWLQENKIYNL